MKNNLKILISSRSFGKINSGAIELLKENGLKPILNPYGKKLTEEQILKMINNSIGIIAGTEEITRKIIESNSNLKVISRYGIGIDNIDLKAAQENNILIFNTPITPSIAVAELTISFILTILKKIPTLDHNLKNDKWKPELGNLLSGKTVGIIGLGRIGKRVVDFLRPFDVKIVAFEINPDREYIVKNKIEIISLKKLLNISDVVTIHIPLTKKTKYLLNKEKLLEMKQTSVLINTSRGGIVNEEDLYEVLKKKKIAGAAFDVFENEPETGKLKELNNIILTPHIATYTFETRRDMEIEAAQNLIKGLREMNLI